MNNKIKGNLQKSFKNIIGELDNTSFNNLLKEELELSDEIQIFNNEGKNKDKFKEEHENLLNSIAEDKSLVFELNNLHKKIESLNKDEIIHDLRENIIKSFNHLSEYVTENEIKFELNILLFEYDFEPEFYLCGFEDNNFKEQILNGSKYLDFDDRNELFNGIGLIDFSNCLKPLIEFEEEIGAEKMNLLENTFSYEYFSLNQELYVINVYKYMHEIFEQSNKDQLGIRIPFKNRIHIYANEHDCEQKSIYILEK